MAVMSPCRPSCRLQARLEKKRQKDEEEERLRLAQQHRLRPHVPVPHEIDLYLSGEDKAEIELIFSTFYKT